MPFVDELASATKVERACLLATPVIGEKSSERFTREHYLSFLMQAHCHVVCTVPVSRAVAARLPPRHHGVREMVISHGQELAIRADLLLENIAALGGDVCAASTWPPTPETAALINYALAFASRGDGVGFLGLIYVTEGTVASLVAFAADRVQRALQLPRPAVAYLIRSDQAFDPVRVRRLERLLNGITRADDRAAVIRSARTAFELSADVLRWPSRQDQIIRDPPDGEPLTLAPAVNRKLCVLVSRS